MPAIVIATQNNKYITNFQRLGRSVTGNTISSDSLAIPNPSPKTLHDMTHYP